MNLQDEHIITLYQKFCNQTASLEELAAFREFLRDDDAEKRLFNILEMDYELSDIHLREIDNFRSKLIFREIISHRQPVRKFFALTPRIAIAASLLILAFSALLYFKFAEKQSQQFTYISAAEDIPPGHMGATLTLADGSEIKLGSASTGMITKEAGILISKNGKGELVYELIDKENGHSQGTNTLATKKGETYRLRLPDGSLVWLNAASSITYNISFNSSKQRLVQLDGEAYFEVAKDDRKPFIVKSRHQEVKVLGTHFNVKAYNDELLETTTLAEGSVNVLYQAEAWNKDSPIRYNDEVKLSPGQQSILQNDHIIVSKVNLENALAWKEGNFIFQGVAIKDIMQDISRWYNIAVIYEGELPDGKFSGNVSRSKNISQILQALESTKLVHFRIEGRKVFVNK
ncbi:FecR domain-containing protein [Pedobacter sp. MC2016-05]|uniref:FecR family protein n=1 Tax=Pedobacter sp. MC2016-05 TaxID=2994474 RepID=UPI002245C4FB|nr:FecR domain-containing protein [Pedobacter sp. MC2016-05]MCX2475358.1 FecR domain-containing protein [Pedobacter sp. MC2016-05]